MQTIKQKAGFILLISLILLLPIIVFSQAPIEQDPSYHLFKDSISHFNIPNCSNVISNLAFLFVGLLGLYQIIIVKKIQLTADLKSAYILLFVGVSLVSIGSGYYHLNPNNQTLVWDRLPMTIAFMALFSILIGEFISAKLAKIILIPLMTFGLSSVLYWYFGELNGTGDLRFYFLVQFIPILSIPIILIFFNLNYQTIAGYWWLLVAYVAAKLFEYFDGVIFEFLGVISGHTLKHLMAAFGMLLLLNYFKKRQFIES